MGCRQKATRSFEQNFNQVKLIIMKYSELNYTDLIAGLQTSEGAEKSGYAKELELRHAELSNKLAILESPENSGKQDVVRLKEAVGKKDLEKVKTLLVRCAKSNTLTETLQKEAENLGIYLKYRPELVGVGKVATRETWQAVESTATEIVAGMLAIAFEKNRGCSFTLNGVPMTLHKPTVNKKTGDHFGWRLSYQGSNGKRIYGVPGSDGEQGIAGLLPDGLTIE